MNVILILTDQLSARWLGCYGNAAAHTPHLDALAARGTRFEHCMSNYPVCMPSRSTMLTGRSAQHHGVFYNGYELGMHLPTYAQVLQQAGVQTLGVGKFHLECHGRSAYNDVTKYGFDRAETTEDIRAGEWLDWVEKTHPDCYEQALATVWPMPHLASYGPSGRDLLSEVREARRKHAPRTQVELTYPSVVPERACQTTWVGDRAIAFLEERDASRPFFLQMSFVDPHDPYDPPERWLECIDPDRIPAPVSSDDPAVAEAIARFRPIPFVRRFDGLDEADWRTRRRHYLASCAFLDDQVGRLTRYLAETGLDQDTVVLFTADHGDMVGEHGLPAKGAWHFDACVRVPLIAAGPGVHAQEGQHVVSLMDLFATITDLAGVEHDAPVEGASLRPLLVGAEGPDRPDAALIETYGSYADMSVPVRARSVRMHDAVLTRFGDGSGMLFDLASDPDETRNLFGRPEAAGLQADLTDLLLQLTECQNIPLPRTHRHPTAQH